MYQAHESGEAILVPALKILYRWLFYMRNIYQ
jgi:hypothetical protein